VLAKFIIYVKNISCIIITTGKSTVCGRAMLGSGSKDLLSYKVTNSTILMYLLPLCKHGLRLLYAV
jgi:hypothetical protein